MFINKLNQLYKPARVLYYLEVEENVVKNLYKGMLPDEILKYANSFGTYDYPGVFFVEDLGREVIGIEYRINDDRIDYPADLKSIELKEGFFYSIEIDDEIDITRDSIGKIFEKISIQI